MNKNKSGIDRFSKTVITISLRLIIYALVLLVIIRAASFAYNFGHDIFYASSVEEAPGRDIEVSIPEGISVKETAKLLKSRGLITNELSFEIQSGFFDLEITPGDYILNTSQTSRQILELLDKGAAAEESKPQKQGRE
ncbi:MAG: aminodeoxychorismate lyase [Johnsonella sp.]|nr:aminodeoxychorismate lyase [Johnsonella sp.]